MQFSVFQWGDSITVHRTLAQQMFAGHGVWFASSVPEHGRKHQPCITPPNYRERRSLPGASGDAVFQHAEPFFLHKQPPDDRKVVKQAVTEAEACELLRRAVVHAATRSAGSIKELRVALEMFTVTFRDNGTTPEAVLIRLKRVIEERSIPSLTIRPIDQLSPIILEQMSTWCIQDYFRQEKD
jgi:hypothetical protein